MTTNGIAHISATAEGQDDLEAVILRVKWDGSLDRSIISQTKATASAGHLIQLKAATLIDAGGHSYSSNTCVEMRWHDEDTPQTFAETFYVVEDCSPFDAVLCRHTRAPGHYSTLSAYPIFARPEKAKEREEQKRRESEASKRREHESRAQVAKIRENLAAAARKHQSVG